MEPWVQSQFHQKEKKKELKTNLNCKLLGLVVHTYSYSYSGGSPGVQGSLTPFQKNKQMKLNCRITDQWLLFREQSWSKRRNMKVVRIKIGSLLWRLNQNKNKAKSYERGESHGVCLLTRTMHKIVLLILSEPWPYTKATTNLHKYFSKDPA
jgi:hypothetical protein